MGLSQRRRAESEARAVPHPSLSPAKQGKGTLPQAALLLAYCSIFLPHVWGRIEVGAKRPRTQED